MNTKLHGVDSTLTEAPAALAKIRHLSDGFKAFQALHTGFSSGLFDWLEKNAPAERRAIADALDLRGAHLGGYLQALEDLGLLEREGTTYTLAQGMSAVLCSSSSWCQAETIYDLLTPSSGWSSLDKFMSTKWEGPSAPWLPTLQHPFAGEARRMANYLTEKLNGRSVRSLLCCDGGDGVFAAIAAEHFPEAKITIVVEADKKPQVQNVLSAWGVSERCEVLTGSPLDLPAVEPVDIAVLFHALYPVRRATNDALTAIAGQLAPGGQLFCAHWFCLEACETAPGGLRDLDKAVLTDSHPMCHVETFCDRFEPIGLVDADRDDLKSEYGITKIHVARKPNEQSRG